MSGGFKTFQPSTATPARVDPKLAVCTFIASGLRLFGISDVTAPKEAGYSVAPTKAKPENQGEASNFTMSQPARPAGKLP